MPNISNPIFASPNRLKIGTFCTNGKGAAQTLVPEAGKLDWAMSVEAARIADEAGYEAVVPYARWKGYVKDDPRHESGAVMDPFTWSAGISQVTRRCGIFVTSHAPTIHPIAAAKQLATIDIMSGGRLGLNVVGGWNKPELEMFGAALREHDARYDHLAEWLQVVRRLWADYDAFDHHGEFFDVVQGVSLPKPLQGPGLPVMNAGGSERGREFAALHADMCFVIVKSEDPAKIRAEVQEYKQFASDKFGRSVQVWTNCFVVQRPTQDAAQDYLQHYAVTQQDHRSLDGWMEMQREQTQLMPPQVLQTFRTRFAAGAGGFPLVGTAERIAEKLKMLSDCGLDGVLLTWVDYLGGMADFNASVLPLLEQMDLRVPAALRDWPA